LVPERQSAEHVAGSRADAMEHRLTIVIDTRQVAATSQRMNWP
jgi:hypothetical protein